LKKTFCIGPLFGAVAAVSLLVGCGDTVISPNSPCPSCFADCTKILNATCQIKVTCQIPDPLNPNPDGGAPTPFAALSACTAVYGNQGPDGGPTCFSGMGVTNACPQAELADDAFQVFLPGAGTAIDGGAACGSDCRTIDLTSCSPPVCPNTPEQFPPTTLCNANTGNWTCLENPGGGYQLSGVTAGIPANGIGNPDGGYMLPDGGMSSSQLFFYRSYDQTNAQACGTDLTKASTNTATLPDGGLALCGLPDQNGQPNGVNIGPNSDYADLISWPPCTQICY
jgi:hypothetical protein